MNDLEENFNKVIELCRKTLSTDEIYNYLKVGNIIEKQVAVLELDEVRSEEDVEILLNNLVGIDGKVRQAVAFKILQLIERYKQFFYCEKFYPIFVSAILDIDSNVCRLVIDSVRFLKDDKTFCYYLVNELVMIINIALEELAKLSFKIKKYTSNKQYFKIYWALETLSYFYKFVDEDKLFSVLNVCSELPEYTIREKCALILKNEFSNREFLLLREKLNNDENYYVRNI